MEVMSPVTCWVYSADVDDNYVTVGVVGRSNQIMVIPITDWATFREAVESIGKDVAGDPDAEV